MDQDERDEFRAVCREFFEKRAGEDRLRRYLDDAPGFDESLWRDVVEQGWALLAVPEHLDGAGAGMEESIVVAEEAGRALQGAPVVSSLAGISVLARFGILEQHPELLEAITAGAIVTFAHGSGFAARDSSTPGMRSVVQVADALPGSYLIVATQTGLDVVSVDRAEVSARRQTMDLIRTFVDVDFGSSAVIAQIEDRSAADDLFRRAVVLQSAESLGVASKAFEMTLEYAKQRRQFDRAIGGFQVIKHRLADMYIELECARVAVSAAAEAIDRDFDVAQSVHTAKAVTGRAASWITSQSQQIHGGIGFTWEHVLHLYIRRAKVNELLLGTSSWHEMELASVLALEV